MPHQLDTIERLRRSLQWSVTLNVLLAISLFLFVVLSALGLTDFEMSDFFGTDPSPQIALVEPDSMTQAVARQLTLWQGKDAAYAPSGEEGDLSDTVAT